MKDLHASSTTYTTKYEKYNEPLWSIVYYPSHLPVLLTTLCLYIIFTVRMQTVLVFSKLLPVILLILLGLILRRVNIITTDGIDIIKKLIVNAGLPAVLFLSFLRVTMNSSFIYLIAGMFVLNLLLLLFGRAVGSINASNRYTPFLFTGFEYGMFALGVFGAAYGEDSIAPIAVIDLGHELFIWFVFVTVLLAASGKKHSVIKTVRSFVTSPIIIAIFLGLFGNAFGLGRILETNLYLSGIKTTITMVGNLTAPLILITIGAGLYFSRKGVAFGLKVLAIRVPVVLALYWIFSTILQKILALPFAYAAGLYTLLIAPPPFIIPLFIPVNEKFQRGEINAVLTLYTLASLILFAIFFAFHPVLT